MKKLLATLLALSLVLCFALTANAARIGGEGVTDISTGNTASQEISITLTDNSEGGSAETLTVYMVDVVWSAVALEYTVTGEGEDQTIVWNPTKHEYELKAADGSTINGSWNNDRFDITVTNHSNDEIQAELTLPANENGVSFSANKTLLTVGRADEGIYLGSTNEAPSAFFTVTVSGIPASDFAVDTVVTITPAP